METYELQVWDEEEEEFWTVCTTHKTGEELDKLVNDLKEKYNAYVWAVLA